MFIITAKFSKRKLFLGIAVGAYPENDVCVIDFASDFFNCRFPYHGM